MEAGAQPLARVRAFALSPTAFRRLALANAAMLVLIVATGATVRLTGSGLGCEHWPGCAQHHFEPQELPQLHRVLEPRDRVLHDPRHARDVAARAAAAPARRSHLLRDAAAGAARRARRCTSTSTHGSSSRTSCSRCVVLTLGVVLAIETRAARTDVAAGLGAHGSDCSSAAPPLVLIVSGTFATASGPHPGSAVVRRLWSFQPAVYWHVRATAVFGISFALLLVWLVRNRAPQVRGALVLLGLLARADGDRRDAVPHAPAVVARARARDGRGDGVGRRHRVRLQPLAPA